MKKTLAFDRNARQFRADIAGKRFYLGDDASAADKRKRQIVELYAKAGEWTADAIATANLIRKGEAVKMWIEPMESEAQYLTRREQVQEALPSGMNVVGTITTAELRPKIMDIMRARIVALEAELVELAGPRVAERSTVTMHEVLDAWIAYRRSTCLIPGTSEPTDSVRGEATMMAFLKRFIAADLRLSDLDYATIDKLCKIIAARPVSRLKGRREEQPIGRNWAKEAIKTIRRIIRWSSRTYRPSSVPPLPCPESSSGVTVIGSIKSTLRIDATSPSRLRKALHSFFGSSSRRSRLTMSRTLFFSPPISQPFPYEVKAGLSVRELGHDLIH